MPYYQSPCLVRILRDNDPRSVKGAGILVDDRHVLTCAYVVLDEGANLEETVYFDFPLLADHNPLRAEVKWLIRPAESPLYGEPEDLCILKLLPDQTMPPEPSARRWQGIFRRTTAKTWR